MKTQSDWKYVPQSLGTPNVKVQLAVRNCHNSQRCWKSGFETNYGTWEVWELGLSGRKRTSVVWCLNDQADSPALGSNALPCPPNPTSSSCEFLLHTLSKPHM